jgi:uncharacterized protein DUF4389
MDGHPVTLVVTDDLRRSRLTVFFRLLLALPHLVWFVLWSIAAVVAAVANWFVTLVTGRPAEGLHGFLSSFVRYGVHLTAYLFLAANPYPGFTGEPGYPVDVELDEPHPQSRLTTALRLPLAVPALLLAAVVGSGGGGGWGGWSGESGGGERWGRALSFGGLVGVCGFLGWFAALALGRMPAGLRNLGAYGIGYTAQTYAYLLLLTDRYPNSDPDAIGPPWELREHPVRLVLEDDGRRSRLTVLFRLLLALPHFVWLTLWSVAALLAALANWIAVLVRGRSADSLHRFLAAYVRYGAHVSSFVSLVANPFPGFTGAMGYPVDMTIAAAERQNRWITVFRTILVIPALILASALTGVLFVVGFLGWFAALATGRTPTGLRNLGAVAIRYLTQTNAYWLILTDSYPSAGPAVRAPREFVESEWEPDPEAA